MAISRLNFGAQVDAWVRQTKERMEAVFKTSAQFVINDVVERTPVDTGYLRASLTVTLDAPRPIRSDARPVDGGSYQVQPYTLTIADAEVGKDTIFASFVASYAAYVEFGAQGRPPRSMVRLAAQNWQTHVDRAISLAKSRVGS